ncbi:type II secretion system secretin GspD [Thiohalobacter sp. IOR34]|uniref:type II secretion system secretin GspD n=1 Tax=Thiohalobacter sp. IOR34 TaxID=3057176 RepID=UPI0025B00A7B|nr:type II secretion system secretin GspD [Thiohalobacter sp. IOR34]WJW75179.1 type II secretion system secretin GspD [Thiohalobacter sp. IOR34]
MNNTNRSFPWRGWLAGLVLLLGLGSQASLRAESVTLNLKDVDINVLIETVAEISGRNFIVDPRVKGKATVISSRPMDAEEVYQVFLSILKVHGFAAVPAGQVVKIVPDVSAKQDAIPTVQRARQVRGDQMVTRVVQIDNVAAAQLVPILRPLVPQQGHLAAYPATNVLIISDRADNVERLVTIIHRIDQQSDSEIEVIPLQHASATEVVRILNALKRGQPGKQPAAAGGAVLIADERTNSVMLGGDRAERLRLRAVITHLDTPLERGGNTHVLYLKYAKAEDLLKVLTGVSSSIEKGQKGKVPPTKGGVNIQADAAANALVITAPPDVFRSLQSVIRQLDVRRAQVLVEAVIAEVTADKAAELGVQWRATEDTSGSGGIGGTNFDVTTSINTVTQNPLATGNGLSLGYFEGTTSILGNDILNLGALVKVLASDSGSNILSTPTLVTLDNEEAEIVVAQNVPFITGQFTNTGAASGATNPFQTIQRQDVGLTLKVKPQINEGDSIRLDIEQESSSVSQTAITGAADIITNKRSIKTSVMVADRQVVVLGGLIDDKLTENVQKVPLLGDIPVLGYLFKSQRTSKVKRNLMVFLRPVILRDAVTETDVSAGKYNFMRARQLQKREAGVNLMPSSEVPVLPEYGSGSLLSTEDDGEQ